MSVYELHKVYSQRWYAIEQFSGVCRAKMRYFNQCCQLHLFPQIFAVIDPTLTLLRPKMSVSYQHRAGSQRYYVFDQLSGVSGAKTCNTGQYRRFCLFSMNFGPN